MPTAALGRVRDESVQLLLRHPHCSRLWDRSWADLESKEGGKFGVGVDELSASTHRACDSQRRQPRFPVPTERPWPVPSEAFFHRRYDTTLGESNRPAVGG